VLLPHGVITPTKQLTNKATCKGHSLCNVYCLYCTHYVTACLCSSLVFYMANCQHYTYVLLMNLVGLNKWRIKDSLVGQLLPPTHQLTYQSSKQFTVLAVTYICYGPAKDATKIKTISSVLMTLIFFRRLLFNYSVFIILSVNGEVIRQGLLRFNIKIWNGEVTRLGLLRFNRKIWTKKQKTRQGWIKKILSRMNPESGWRISHPSPFFSLPTPSLYLYISPFSCHTRILPTLLFFPACSQKTCLILHYSQ